MENFTPSFVMLKGVKIWNLKYNVNPAIGHTKISTIIMLIGWLIDRQICLCISLFTLYTYLFITAIMRLHVVWLSVCL